MSAPFKATAADLEALAAFLKGLSQLTQETGVGLYSATDIELPNGGSTVNVNRATTAEGVETYAIDDRIGS